MIERMIKFFITQNDKGPDIKPEPCFLRNREGSNLRTQWVSST